MKPLAGEIWFFMLGAYVLVSLTMWIVARFSPYEWHLPLPCDHDHDCDYEHDPETGHNGYEHVHDHDIPDHCEHDHMHMHEHDHHQHEDEDDPYASRIASLLVAENDFTLANSFWFAIGTLMQQGSDLNPKVP